MDQLADRLGPGAVGTLQAALGNLPELFVCTFALHHGLTAVVSAALIGSILGNMLLSCSAWPFVASPGGGTGPCASPRCAPG